MAEPIDDFPDAEKRSRAYHRLWHSFHSANSYGVLLLMIIATYAVAVSVNNTIGVSILLVIMIATVWLALRTSLAGPIPRRIANVIFVFAAAVAVANLFVEENTKPAGILFLVASLLYFLAPLSIVRHLAFRHRVDEETMLGALAAYLLIGIAFANAYRCIAHFQDGPFFGSAGDGTLSDDLFFSFVTLTTTGYGNLTPAENPGQSLAVLEALLGQLFLVTAVAKVVNAWTPRRWPGKQAGEPSGDA